MASDTLLSALGKGKVIHFSLLWINGRGTPAEQNESEIELTMGDIFTYVVVHKKTKERKKCLAKYTS